MSRAGTGDTVVVKPAINVYTVLTIVATLASVIAIIVVLLREKDLSAGGLF